MPLEAFKAKNGTTKVVDPLGEVWDKVAEWKADYLAKKNATVAKLVAVKADKPKATTPPPTSPIDVAGADAPTVPAAVVPPSALNNADAVRFVKADLPADVKAELAADASSKGMKVIEGDA